MGTTVLMMLSALMKKVILLLQASTLEHTHCLQNRFCLPTKIKALPLQLK